jgi:glycosyltransferase involved in cell wall biosynthesis
MTTAPEKQTPRVIVGAPLYNKMEFLGETLDSLRSQTFSDFVVLMADDASTDGTAEVARAIAERDSRFTYIRNEQNLGYLGCTRLLAREGQRRWPDAEYFVWASDHDLWHPDWMERLVAALDANPKAALAWCLTNRIDEQGRVLRRVINRYEIDSDQSPFERFVQMAKGIATNHATAGNMIYGLFRLSMLPPGPAPNAVMLPDRLLLLRASLRGGVIQVPTLLWYRRFEGIASPGRQRRNLFGGHPPFHAWLPPSLSHIWLVLWEDCVLGRASPWLKGADRFKVAVTFPFLFWSTALVSRLERTLPQWKRVVGYQVVKPIQMSAHRIRKRLLGRISALKRRLT